MSARVLYPDFLSGGPIVERATPAEVLPLQRHGPSASLRELARYRHGRAVEALKAGDTVGFLKGIREVDKIESEMRRARRYEDWAIEMARKVTGDGS